MTCAFVEGLNVRVSWTTFVSSAASRENTAKGSEVTATTCSFKNECLAELWSDSEEGSYSRLIDCITQL